jgi:predicted MFS family arabinose efflux permease
VALSAVAAAVASVGFAASLVLQERLMSLTPDELAGQALGLHTTGMVALQGIGAALAGTLAQVTSPAMAMTLMAAASIAVTLTLFALERPLERRHGPDGVTPDLTESRRARR